MAHAWRVEVDASLVERIAAASKLLQRIANDYSPAALASSFGAEDMVLIDLVAGQRFAVSVFTLDTGRLPEQTHALIEQTRERYGLPIAVYFPDAARIEKLTRDHGTNAFFQSVDLRKTCCHARKVEPLRRALEGKKAWITGLRRAQSPTRGDVALESFDAGHGLQKFNPLAHWSERDVWDYLREHAVPYNALHDQGYASIGCAPCTRAITPGEDLRAGRWWWEDAQTKECGLHPAATVPIVVRAPREPAGAAR